MDSERPSGVMDTASRSYAGKSERGEDGKGGGGVHQSRDSISIMSKCIA